MIGLDPDQNPNSPPPPADSDVVARLMPLVYDELRRMAASLLRREGPLTIQPTALVHEAFMKLASETGSSPSDHVHIRALAAVAMRRILIDHVRARQRVKRGGNMRAVSLDVALLPAGQPCSAETLDEAIGLLESEHPRAAQLVIFRFFGGLSVGEAADRLGISTSTAESDWRFGRAWLRRHLSGASA
ncbi:MAG: ECF-type sigma factor [Planctomycetota bacterium]|nr:ECF-type sigma factor [Planctomycetota bacterium]